MSLGVAVVVAVDLTNASAEKSFESAQRTVAGGVTHQIISDTGPVEEESYVRLRKQHGIRHAMPVITGEAGTVNGDYYRIIGIDPVVLLDRSSMDAAIPRSVSPLSFLTVPNGVVAGERIRNRLVLDVDDEVTVTSNGKQTRLKVIGFISDHNQLQNRILRNSFVTDIATAQTILGREGELSRIDLILSREQAEQIRTSIPPPLQLVRTAGQSDAMREMTRAFRTNLTAMSLLSLVIGAFLIYNTMTISVLQRRNLIATVRTLGLSRFELLMVLMGEALLLALAGIILGCALGTGLSHYLLVFTSKTLEDLYQINEVRTVYYNIWSYIGSAGLGLAAALFSSYLPTRDAMRIAPEVARSRSRLEHRARSSHVQLMIAAAVMTCISIIILSVSDRSIVAGFASLFFIILAYALLSPVLLVLLMKVLQPLMTRILGLFGSIAGRGILASLSRTQVAVAALAIAISATIGVGIMISSFRLSVGTWLDDFFKADVFITPVSETADPAIPPDLVSRVRRLPGVNKLTTGRWRNLRDEKGLTRLYVSDIDREIFGNYRFKDTVAFDRWEAFSQNDAVLVSEPYAWHHQLRTGDTIHLPTDQGERSFRIAGIYYHYGSDRGVVTIHRNSYETYWNDRNIGSLFLYLDESVDVDDRVNHLNREILSATGLNARGNRQLRELSMRIFDRTFAVTEVLRFITFFIAAIGILGALMAIQLEREREFAVLRAMGVTPTEIRKLLLSEGGLMGAVAGLVAVPLGLILALMLIHVINRRSFGWSMDFVPEPVYLLNAVLLGLIAGILAGLYPAWRMVASPPVSGLRDE